MTINDRVAQMTRRSLKMTARSVMTREAQMTAKRMTRAAHNDARSAK